MGQLLSNYLHLQLCDITKNKIAADTPTDLLYYKCLLWRVGSSEVHYVVDTQIWATNI